MAAYELKLEKFQGPLDKLLELIESRKLEITEISLAEVTGDFLEYLNTLTNADYTQTNADIGAEQQGSFSVSPHPVRESLRLVADFIAVASRLILIKSKSLLPDATLTSDEEAEIKDLEERLKIYRRLKPIMKLLQDRWQKNEAEFSRPYFLNTFLGAGIFYPGKNLSLESLKISAEETAAVIQRFVSEEETVAKGVISIEEKIKEIVGRLQKFAEVNFSHFSGNGQSRTEIIAAFLAILHMAYERLILLEQKSHFSDILIKKSDPV